jgi:hypothetical protein
MSLKLKLATIAIGAAVLAVPTAALASSASNTTSDLQIALKPSAAFPKATGSAQYQSQPGQSEFQIEVEHLRKLAGRYVLVRVNGAEVGRAKVSRTGIAELSRNTELGQSVPSIVHGSTVTVTRGAKAPITSGTF